MHLAHSNCDHGHAIKLNRAFGLAVVLNILLVVGEAVGGFVSGSMALLADAGHNMSDVAGLALAWWAHWLRGKGRTDRWTYGWRSFTMLAANINGILLVVAIIGVSVESIRRLYEPSEVSGLPVLIVASIAMVLNFLTARLLVSGSSDDLNVRGAYLHMLADAAVSLAVVVGAAVIMLTGWVWLDAAISLGICVVLAFGTWGLLRESTAMLLHAVPRRLDLEEIRTSLLSHADVTGVVDLHVWSASTTEPLLTAKIECIELSWGRYDELRRELHASLEKDFAIAHATLEIVRKPSAFSQAPGIATRPALATCPLDQPPHLHPQSH